MLPSWIAPEQPWEDFLKAMDDYATNHTTSRDQPLELICQRVTSTEQLVMVSNFLAQHEHGPHAWAARVKCIHICFSPGDDLQIANEMRQLSLFRNTPADSLVLDGIFVKLGDYLLAMFSILFMGSGFHFKRIRVGRRGTMFYNTSNFFSLLPCSNVVELTMDLTQSKSGWDDLTRILPRSKLESLHICCVVESMTAFAQAVQKSSLIELDLSNSTMQHKAAEELFSLMHSTRLQKLILADCNMCETALPILFTRLPEFTALSFLSLQDVSISTREAVLLSTKFSRLTALNLSGCAIGDFGMRAIFRAMHIAGGCALKTLDVSGNELGDASLHELCAALQSEHCRLEVLSAMSNNFSEEVVRAYLFPALQHANCRTLKQLHMFPSPFARETLFHVNRMLVARTLRVLLSACSIRRFGTAATPACRLPVELIRLVGEMLCTKPQCFDPLGIMGEEEEGEEDEEEMV